jgi:hypothetical protein
MPLSEKTKEEIERDILLLRESMDILHEMILEQGEILDEIEENVAITTTDVADGTKELPDHTDHTDHNIWLYVISIGGLLSAITWSILLL